MLKRIAEHQSTRSRDLINAMTTLTKDRGYDFKVAWLQKHSWVIVPVESTGHLAEEEIDHIVPTLRSAGCISCLAIGADDLPAPLPNCFELSVTTDDLRAFNVECGPFRFLLTDADLSWAISCNEWFNLFAGPQALVEQLLGIPIKQAHEEFLEYAKVVEQGSDQGTLMQIARRYKNSDHSIV